MKKIGKLFKLSKIPGNMIIIVSGTMIFLAVFNVIISALLQVAVDIAIYESDIRKTGVFAILLLLSCNIYIYISFIFPVYKEKLYQQITKNLKTRVLDGVLKKPLREIENIAEGDFLTTVIEDCDNCGSYLIQSVLPATQLIVNILAGLIFVLLQEWRIGLILMLCIPIFYFINKSCAQKYEAAYETYMTREGEQKTFYSEIHKNILVVLAYRLQEKMNKKSEKIYNHKFNAAKKQAKSVSNMITFTETSVLCVELVVLFCGIIFSQMGWIKIGSMIAIWNVAIGSVIYPISELPYVITGLIGQIVSLDRIENMVLFKDSENNSILKERLEKPCLKVKNVRYDVSENFRLSVDKFECDSNQIVYIIGESGSGKSTFAKLLLSLYNPDEGEIRIEDRDGKIKSTEKYVAYIPQEKMMCKLSLKDNLSMGNESISRENIIEAMIEANIYDVVKASSEEIDIFLEKDRKLSVGQEQRVAIARAYLSDAEFFIFDEPFSALDENNIQIVSGLIRKIAENHGCIVITHDVTMITENDCVYEFKGGVLHEKK